MRKEAAKTAILEAARELRNTEYKDVSIVPDLTPLQRKEEAGLAEEAERRNRSELTQDDQQKNLRWLVVGPRGARRLIKAKARAELGGAKGGRTSRGARGGGTRGGTRPAVPQPSGRQPVLPGPELLPSRKRNREWRAAMDTEEDGTEEVEEDENEEGTRSPANKK
jgi:hypothetical protein